MSIRLHGAVAPSSSDCSTSIGLNGRALCLSCLTSEIKQKVVFLQKIRKKNLSIYKSRLTCVARAKALITFS